MLSALLLGGVSTLFVVDVAGAICTFVFDREADGAFCTEVAVTATRDDEVGYCTDLVFGTKNRSAELDAKW